MQLHLCIGVDARNGKSALAFRVLGDEDHLVGLASAQNGDIKHLFHERSKPSEVEEFYGSLIGTITASEMKATEVIADDLHLDEYLETFGFNEASIGKIWDLFVKTETITQRIEVNSYAVIEGFGAF